MSNLGLVLSGGGARGAYQAGVLAAIADVASNQGLSDPFNIFTGVSAGSINATILASHNEPFLQATQYLTKMWGQITTDDVFYVDLMTLSRGGFDWIADFSLSKKKKNDSAIRSLLSTTPLRSLINQTCQFDNIQKKINTGKVRGLSVSALDYENISTKTFFQGAPDLTPWSRPMHRSENCEITSEHVMASTAIPLLFPPTKLKMVFLVMAVFATNHPVPLRSTWVLKDLSPLEFADAKILGSVINTPRGMRLRRSCEL